MKRRYSLPTAAAKRQNNVSTPFFFIDKIFKILNVSSIYPANTLNDKSSKFMFTQLQSASLTINFKSSFGETFYKNVILFRGHKDQLC